MLIVTERIIMNRLMLFILLVLCAVGAPELSVAVELMATPQVTYSLQSAKTYYTAGETEAALSTLRRYIIETPDSPKLNEAYTLIARILLEQQRNSDALFYLQRIEVDQRTLQASLLMVVALQREQQMALAGELLATLSVDQFSGDDKIRYYQLKSADHLFRQQPLQALVVLRAALQHAAQPVQAQLFAQSLQILQQLDDAQTAEVGFMFARTELNDAFSLHKAQQALEEGDEAVARQIAEPLISGAKILAAKFGAANVMDQVCGQRWQQRAVGVVLPLTGRYAPFGNLVRQGIELAISEAMMPSLRLIYRDSQADAQRAAQAVNELVNGDRVMAVIGPLMALSNRSPSLRQQKCRC
jgi:outer membrane PBP1 activator LpoA protein